MLKDLFGRKDIEKKRLLAQPLDYMNKDFPKTFLMSATGDFLLDQVKLMEEKLNALQVEHVVKIYGDDHIQPAHVFHCDIKQEIARCCNLEQCQFLKENIKEQCD